MKLTSSLLSLTVLASLVVMSRSVASAPTPSPTPCPVPTLADCVNTIPHEPIVILQVQGSTLVTEVDETLIVQGNGTSTFARHNSVFPGGGFDTKVETRSLGSAAAVGLLRDLFEAGAFDLCDETFGLNDVPRSTLTVFRGADTDRLAHTFSYTLVEGAVADVHQVLQNFLATHFPNG